MRSLFYIALALGVFRLEHLIQENPTQAGYRQDFKSLFPPLTLFAIEEPENHLSPHYVGQIIAALREIADEDGAQVILSSHSPSILGRIEPEEVRYFLGNEDSTSTAVIELPLPPSKDESFKFVREAVRAYPELYFSKMVVLGEGPSEEIVLKRLFEASGVPLDRQFTCIVPLGGRHVNHFWRLLQSIGVPFLTLLDLDIGRNGAGWARIKYVRDQLMERFRDKPERLVTEDDAGRTIDLADSAHDTLGDFSISNQEEMESWLNLLSAHYGVFFSTPLDLDFSMLEAFPQHYTALAPEAGGPRIPSVDDENYAEYIQERMHYVLSADFSESTQLSSIYSEHHMNLFAWYKYLFIDGSKPVAHMRAMLSISDEELIEHAPSALKKVLEHARNEITAGQGGV